VVHARLAMVNSTVPNPSVAGKQLFHRVAVIANKPFLNCQLGVMILATSLVLVHVESLLWVTTSGAILDSRAE